MMFFGLLIVAQLHFTQPKSAGQLMSQTGVTMPLQPTQLTYAGTLYDQPVQIVGTLK
jgi:hypothetical protein